MKVPFFRVQIGEAERREVLEVLESGWLTTGPRVRTFEAEFAAAVGAKHAIALNSATAALHLAVEALGLRAGEGVLVPTATFAATAEIVRYLGAIPILVDADPDGQIDLDDADRAIGRLARGELPAAIPPSTRVVGMIPVHYGGVMVDVARARELARARGLWMVEDAAHSFPAAYRADASSPWVRCGERTSDVTCFSFYANKTITTGEGGMATTDDERVADRMRLMSLHGLSRDAWNRYQGGGWDYRIVAPGFKYNMTDVAAAVGIHQLRRAEELRRERERVARIYVEQLGDVGEIELPAVPTDRIHAWHLFPLRLRLDQLTIDRNLFIDRLNAAGIGTSVHWRPLHLHNYYAETFGWRPEHLPAASALFPRTLSIPLFAGITDAEVGYVVESVRRVARDHAR